MPIKQPHEITAGNKKVRILIAGYPGIGKSTVGLSAPNPLHIDVDRGMDRVAAIHRKSYVQPSDYQELLADLTPQNLQHFETLVFDTGGQLAKLITEWVIRQNPKHGKTDGSLQLQGWGALKNEFERLMNYCFYTLGKHIVMLCHAKEEKEGDVTRLRLLIEGGTRENIWQPMDLGGFMEMQGNKRTIGFTNCERYYAKSTHGVSGLVEVPHLASDVKNTFLADMFASVNDHIAREASIAADLHTAYTDTIALARDAIAGIKSPQEAMDTADMLRDMTHALTSEKEIRAIFAQRIKELGFVFDKQQKQYMYPEGDSDLGASDSPPQSTSKETAA